MGEEPLYIKSGETSFSMEQEVESLVPPSSGYFYQVYGRDLVKWKRMQKAKIAAIKHR